VTKRFRYVGHHFNQVIVIQSLDEFDVPTSDDLLKFIRTSCDAYGHNVEFRAARCANATEFVIELRKIANDCRRLGWMPLIHIETHGDEESGLVFANGSELNWEHLTAELRAINLASDFNLLVVCSACYGFHCIGQIDILKCAPFYAVLAPTDAIDPGEIYATMYSFYREALKSRDLGQAFDALQRTNLREGYWFCIGAEHWYERLLLSFASKHCTDIGIDGRAKAHYRKLLELNRFENLGAIKRKLVPRLANFLRQEAYENFFALQEIPANGKRFSTVYYRVFDKLKRMKLSRHIKL